MAEWSRELLGKRVFVEELTAFCLKAMDACGMRKESAQSTADVLVTTDTWGIHTHGSKQLRPLLGLRPGRMDPKAVPEIVTEGPAWVLVDGHSAIAPASACAGMEAAMRKASAAGIGYAGVFGSNHFGAAAYYAAMALRDDMIGIAMTNVNPLVTIPGGKTAVLGTNPIAYAAPAGEERPILFDIATSVVAASKVITVPPTRAGRGSRTRRVATAGGIPRSLRSCPPDRGERPSLRRALAQWLLFLRAHWLRMPTGMLIKHLWTQARRRGGLKKAEQVGP